MNLYVSGKHSQAAKAQNQFSDELLTSMVIPKHFADAAKDFDRKKGDYVTRGRYSISDYIQNDIPFWRNKLPEKGEQVCKDRQ